MGNGQLFNGLGMRDFFHARCPLGRCPLGRCPMTRLCFKSASPTAGATTEGTSLRVRHFDGTETDTAEWTHRNALPDQRTGSPMPHAQCPMPNYPCPITNSQFPIPNYPLPITHSQFPFIK
ncbi:MAG: hypothetical protein KME31_21020 [Tolypothrix carrinoi HA7290-LM1]|nr:hypothetical protein [Tolypothrix carrinoi HA7290-LM1]